MFYTVKSLKLNDMLLITRAHGIPLAS